MTQSTSETTAMMAFFIFLLPHLEEQTVDRNVSRDFLNVAFSFAPVVEALQDLTVSSMVKRYHYCPFWMECMMAGIRQCSTLLGVRWRLFGLFGSLTFNLAHAVGPLGEAKLVSLHPIDILMLLQQCRHLW
jgi:hypothetical protein